MTIYSDIIKYGDLTLYIKSISPQRVAKTIKQVIGAELVQVSILGMKNKQWVLSINGVVVDDSNGTLAQNRAALEALDNTSPHFLEDGHHDGLYYIEPGSLSFTDAGDTSHSMFEYSVTLVER